MHSALGSAIIKLYGALGIYQTIEGLIDNTVHDMLRVMGGTHYRAAMDAIEHRHYEAARSNLYTARRACLDAMNKNGFFDIFSSEYKSEEEAYRELSECAMHLSSMCVRLNDIEGARSFANEALKYCEKYQDLWYKSEKGVGSYSNAFFVQPIENKIAMEKHRASLRETMREEKTQLEQTLNSIRLLQ